MNKFRITINEYKMKKKISTILMLLLCIIRTQAQTTAIEGSCGNNMKWSFDGSTLTISITDQEQLFPMDDYNMEKNMAPWRKKGLDIRRVKVGSGVTSIGSCAFAGCENLTEVLFEGSALSEIGWGAFYNCTRLHSISLPVELKLIEKVAFAKCRSLNSIKIPAQCRVEDQAFASCNNLQSIECASTSILGRLVFVKEDNIGGKMQHSLYSGDILHIPSYINVNNCHLYGLSKDAVEKAKTGRAMEEDYDEETSKLDTEIPVSGVTRNDTYVLIIGNQNYRFVPDVPYAIHDARIFSEYCKKTLGIPSNHIHIAENATKHMILEEELSDWVAAIQNPEQKRLIIYYAGHGVPDTENGNKAYILPTDVRGTHPKRGIALDEFYAKVGELDFAQTTIFLDACFSGINRNNEGVTETTRAVEIVAEEAPLSEGSIVVFSAAQGNETAQGFPEQGHGLFTYYLLQELRITNGDVRFGRLSDNIKRNVSIKAGELRMRKQQTPSTIVSDKLTETWRGLNF